MKVQEPLYAEVAAVIQTVQSGQDASEAIVRLATRKETRGILYGALHEINRPEQFPPRYASLEQIAESHLVLWLLHPNELNVVPDEIELARTVEREEGDPPEKYRFFIFEFRVSPSHFAAKDGWLAGIAGPYFLADIPVSNPPCVFSRFEQFGAYPPEEHLKRTEELVLHAIKR